MSKTTVVTKTSPAKKNIATAIKANTKAAPTKKVAVPAAVGKSVSLEGFEGMFNNCLTALSAVLPQVTPQISEDGTEFRIRSRATRCLVLYYRGKDGSKSLAGVPRQLHPGYDPELKSIADGGKGKVATKEQGRYGNVLNPEMPKTGAVGYAASAFDIKQYAADLKKDEWLHRD